MTAILLVNPAFATETLGAYVSPRRSLAARWSPFQVGVMPLGLATVAALTPEDIQVDIWDEAVEGPLTAQAGLRRPYDLVGVTGYVNHAGRMTELGTWLRARGLSVVVGGPGVSSEPELFREHFDVLFIGEAELTWPRFLVDWRAGSPRREYRQVERVDVTRSPLPRWDGVRTDAYMLGAVQTARGCPFDCEFCDVIYIFGRESRYKTIAQVLAEVSALERLGVERVLFCDDNFAGKPPYAKKLVRELIPLNRSFRRPLSFFTNITLNAVHDGEFLAAMADANFAGVFIGIESPNPESLLEANKASNQRVDMAAAVAKVHAHGIVVQSGMILGFDHDEEDVFDRHFSFLQQAGVPVPMVNLLKAPKGTKLWARLHREGRVLQSEELTRTSNVESLTNVVPRRMTQARLLAGYLGLVERLRDWDHFEARVRRLLAQVKRRPALRTRVGPGGVLLLLRMLWQMNFAGRRSAVRLLLHTLARRPFMAERVMGAVAYQYQEALRVPHLKRSVGERIRALTAGQGLQREQAALFVPDELKPSYRAFFPDLYERIHAGLLDRTRTHPTLVEVTSDFLARCGAGLRRLEADHHAFLYELCDRAVAAENRAPRAALEGPPAAAPAPGADRRAWLDRLCDDVIRCVEQDLRRAPSV